MVAIYKIMDSMSDELGVDLKNDEEEKAQVEPHSRCKKNLDDLEVKQQQISINEKEVNQLRSEANYKSTVLNVMYCNL